MKKVIVQTEDKTYTFENASYISDLLSDDIDYLYIQFKNKDNELITTYFRKSNIICVQTTK